MRKVTEKDIVEINEAYLLLGTYSAAAKATGWSPSTVKKYIIPNYTSQVEVPQEEIVLPDIDEVVKSLLKCSHALQLTIEEVEELALLQKELLV